MFKGYVFNGQAYRHQELTDLVDDFGGYIVSKRIMASDATITFFTPEDSLESVKRVSSELRAELKEISLLGAEVAVVAPSMARHHLPHLLCDIAEFLRRNGAKTNMIGLARGVGQRIAQLTPQEKALIEEHDTCVFVLGNFEHCLREYKWALFKDVEVPTVVTGGPELEKIPYATRYVGGIGRLPYRFRLLESIEKLERIVRAVGECLELRQKEIEEDPLATTPLVVGSEMIKLVKGVRDQDYVPPAPVVMKLDGVRVKLPYDRYRERVENLLVRGRPLKEIAQVSRSKVRGHVLVKILPASRLDHEPLTPYPSAGV